MDRRRWEPFYELEDLKVRLNTIFGAQKQQPVRSGREAMTVPDWVPVVDIIESDEEFLIKAELPEVQPDDIKINIQDGVLTIHGERRHEKTEKTPKLHRMERSYGVFTRRFIVPDGVDEKGLRADFRDGMLRLHLPKSAQSPPHVIEINVD